jgi:hypothetical protein
MTLRAVISAHAGIRALGLAVKNRPRWCSSNRCLRGGSAVGPEYTLLLLRKLALEMTFNFFAIKRVSHFVQHDRIDDPITFNLRSDKRFVLQQFLVGEFHSSAVRKRFDPLVILALSFLHMIQAVQLEMLSLAGLLL